MAGRWTWREATADDRADQCRLFNLCFRKDKQVDTFEWKYAANPHGPAVSRVACDEQGDVVGAYSYVPRRFRRDGEPVVLAQASDAMVDPGWQRKGIFTGLDDVVASASGEAGMPLAFAYSGRLSLKGFLSNGWQQIGHAPLYRYRFHSRRGLLRLGRVGPLAARTAPLIDAAWSRRDRRRFADGQAVAALTRVQRFDAAADELFEACVPERGLLAERDAAWLNWRWIDNPSRRQECYALRAPDGGRMDGYLVAEFVGGHAYLVDHLARDAGSRRTLMAAFTAMAHARGVEEAGALLFEHHPAVPVLRELGWSRPVKDRPFRDIFPFIVRTCRADASPDDLTMTRWFLADGDRDAEHMSP